MKGILLTANSSFIIGPVAKLLGVVMNAIFWIQEKLGFANIGLSIILFTVAVYMLLMPFTIKQQKFSKLQPRMVPELSAIQRKYEGKNQDQAAMLQMSEETRDVYDKFGVSPMGSCLQLIIQMPILFSLYHVINNIPAYVRSVKNVFMPLVQALIGLPGAEAFMGTVAQTVGVKFSEMTELTLIDVLYKFKPENWGQLADKFPDISDVILSTQEKMDGMNYFLGLNIADSPANIMNTASAAGATLLAVGAAMIPILSFVSQWINTRIIRASSKTPTDAGNGKKKEADSEPQSANMINNVMMVMSAFFCLTLPVGMGIYWIAGAIIRTVQQVVISRRIDKLDIDTYVAMNVEKVNKKRAQAGQKPIKNVKVMPEEHVEIKNHGKEKNVTDTSVKSRSLAEKAQMVKRYNERVEKEKADKASSSRL